MAENLYLYAVARIRSREQALLSASFLQQLISAPDYEACLNMLREKGWGEKESDDPDRMFAAEREKTWDLMRELLGDVSVFDVFLYGNDFHNLKVAIKECRSRKRIPDLYMDQGCVPVEVIRKAADTGEFDVLPERMQGPAAEARRVFLQTGNGQLCDLILDKAALEAVCGAGKQSGNEFLALYGELTAACADIKIAVRGAAAGKDRDFLMKALAACDSVRTDELADAAAAGREAVAEYLERTDYHEGADALRQSLSAFERWCDDLIMKKIRPQLYNAFGLGPLAAYILARENEIKSVRMILAGKRSGLQEETVRERIRETYV